MDTILKYYEFSDFFKDQSNTFSGNDIAYTILNDTHFLIFEKNKEEYTLFVSKYGSKSQIGKEKPQILEILVENYDKSIPAHRLAITQYLK